MAIDKSRAITSLSLSGTDRKMAALCKKPKNLYESAASILITQ